MDHHCPWTANCVSLTTTPHFLRFVFYAVISMSILTYHLVQRIRVLIENRNLPAYLGPPIWTMVHLFVLTVVNSIVLFALAILLVRSIYSLAINTTQIESWEIERHEALVVRARYTGGFVYASGGQRLRIDRQEFPYDVGIWTNLCAGMGTSMFPLWFLPFGGGPSIADGSTYPVNGFEDSSKTWPPPDPDKLPKGWRAPVQEEIQEYASRADEVEAFRRRQQKDLKRWEVSGGKGSDSATTTARASNQVKTETRNRDRDGSDADIDGADAYSSEYEEGLDGEPGWTNAEGDRLRDYGVDEEAEILADDDIPLSELLRRRRGRVAEF